MMACKMNKVIQLEIHTTEQNNMDFKAIFYFYLQKIYISLYC